MKRNIKISLIVISIILILIISFFIINRTEIINRINQNKEQEEIKKEISYEVYHHVNGDTKMLVVAEDTENGIEKVIYPNNEMELYCNGKNKVAFDYHVNITNLESITFTAINTLGEEIKNTVIINEEFYKNMIKHNFINETETQKGLTINYKADSAMKQYKVGEAANWANYTNTIRLDEHQILETLGEENREVNISLRQVDKIGNEIITQTKLTIENKASYKKEDTIIEGESILACVENNELQTGNYIFRVAGTIDGGTEEVKEYPVELYNYKEDANYIGQNNVVIGDISYTGMGKIDSEKRMLILKYNKDLNINEGAIITPTGTNEAINGATYLCTKKGILIYCEGTITNNGTITMTAKGTVNEAGENVYLYKNENNSYEYIPAVGASGGASVTSKSSSGNSGKGGNIGTDRRTGGGGSGGAASKYTFESGTSGRGGSGTSYSGGAGGGAAYWSTASAGSDVGGKGGNAAWRDNIRGGSGGGAGNPGGNRAAYASHSTTATNGSNGTGGLLILYASNVENKGSILSNGSSGGNGGNNSSHRRRRLRRRKYKYIL